MTYSLLKDIMGKKYQGHACVMGDFNLKALNSLTEKQVLMTGAYEGQHEEYTIL